VANFAKIGVNLLHLYDWSVPPAPGQPPGPYQRNHLPFLEECAENHIGVMVPISNYFLQQLQQNNPDVPGQILAMVTEIYQGGTSPVPAAAMWAVANEYDLSSFDASVVASAMACLVQAEQQLGITAANLLPVTSPVSFAATDLPPGITALQNLEAAIKANAALGAAFWEQRFVASVNPFNDAAFLTTYIDSTFGGYFPDLPFFFAEMGIPIPGGGITDEKGQAEFVLGQLNASKPRGSFLGRCVFQFLNQSAMKTGTEATFGMTKYAPPPPLPRTAKIPAGYTPGGGETYPVDALAKKPLYDSVSSAYLAH
jgi:hypothetical protein